MRITSAAVHRIAEESILHRLSNRKKENARRQFVAAFGINPRVAAAIWNRLDGKDLLPKNMMVKHLLWALLFLKMYQPEKVLCCWCGADEKTYRTWIWDVIDILGELDLVRRDCLVDPSCRCDPSCLYVRVCAIAYLLVFFFCFFLSICTDQMEEPVHER